MADTRSLADLRNWLISSRSDSDGLYALAVLNKKFATSSQATLQQVATQEFVFKVNPKTIDLEEPAAVTITPTQDGGQFVERQGSIYKNVNITGTTGLRPNKAGPLIIPIVGVPLPSAPNPFNLLSDPRTLLPRGESSGFQDFIDLRNLFRAYFDAVQDLTTSADTIMVWQNGKEGEFYLVEPISFKTRRESSSPLTFAYDIQLRTISKLSFRSEPKTDVMLTRNALQTFNGRMAQAVRELSAALNTFNAIGDRITGIAQATINNILIPTRTLLNALTSVPTSSTSRLLITSPRTSLVQLAINSLSMYESLGNFTTEMDLYREHGISSQLIIAREAAKRIQRAVSRVVAEDSLFSQPLSQKLNTRSSAYRNTDNNSRPPYTGGSPTDLQNVSAGNATVNATIMGSENIFTAAQRLLGDKARWKELVITNDLKPPYIDPTGDGSSVLRPGDTILVPVTGGSAPLSGVAVSKQPEDDFVARLGRDLLLIANSVGGAQSVFDIARNQRGDVDRIEGVPNMEQAIEIKFSTEQNTLPTHPEFGLQYPLGTKALIRSIVGFQLNARTSLLADTRIGSVENLSFHVDGNVFTTTADLVLAGMDQTVSISFDARR